MPTGTRSRPILIVVSGPPATGKTTLARLIASTHDLPRFSRDAIKELLFDTLSPDLSTFTRADSGMLGLQAAMQLLHLTRELTGSGVSLVIESNFRPVEAAVDLAPFLEIADVRQVHCSVAPDELHRRYKARYERGERHVCHMDGEVLATWGQGYEEGIDLPIPLDAPLMQVATDKGYEPGLTEILRFSDPTRIPDGVRDTFGVAS